MGRFVNWDSRREGRVHPFRPVRAPGPVPEVERDLISERTKEGLAAAKAKGKLLGRPKGALGTSRLDGKEQDIRALLGKEVSKASIAKILDVSRSALYHFIQTRKIAPG